MRFYPEIVSEKPPHSRAHALCVCAVRIRKMTPWLAYLTPEDWATARTLASWRYANAHADNGARTRPDLRYAPQGAGSIELTSSLGEVVVWKRVLHRSFADFLGWNEGVERDRYDMLTDEGLRIEVKTALQPHHHLLVPSRQVGHDEVDVYYGCRAWEWDGKKTLTVMALGGWISAERFMRTNRPHYNTGQITGYTVENESLNDGLDSPMTRENLERDTQRGYDDRRMVQAGLWRAGQSEGANAGAPPVQNMG